MLTGVRISCIAALVFSLEQFAGWTNRAFDLPQRAAAIVAEGVERADLCERRQLIASDTRSRDEIFDRDKATGLGIRD
jgi:hypothetical protein